MRGVGVYLSPVPAQRATFLDALPLLSWSLEQAANNVGIFGEKLWRTPQKEYLPWPLQELQMSHLPM